ncbi:adenylate kinase 8 [Clupea harengus]|uniref:Adenylate kinase 8 n=1 Tax=Clupea harengus TaxID=7950 RepID=A0A6P8FUB0_CLUHA|nr:adenylate kinase 8 [Clupea harengus]XP_031426704.1 adenylate kinase 8 [Clupea harengus]
MDATVKPLRIPPEMAIYAEKHGIFDLLQSLLRNVVVDKPEDPIKYLIRMLKRGNTEVPRVILLGPPSSGKRTVAKALCERTQAIHITVSHILKEDPDFSGEAKQSQEKGEKIPTDLWIRMIQHRLSRIDCVCRGWVLEGIPRTRDEALCLQEAGIAPDYVVVLEAPDDVLIERSLGKEIDPETGDVYHLAFMRPESEKVIRRLQPPKELLSKEQVAKKLLLYHREAHGLLRTYGSWLHFINADQPHMDVSAQVLAYVLSRPRSSAPHTPRILLFGPPGSGKSLQARLLVQKYNIIEICSGELIKAVYADESSVGELLRPYLEAGQQVPDSIVLQILTMRLSRLDCTTRGWVLHGFPRDEDQAEQLRESNHIPSRVFFLDMTDDVAVERLCLRAIDPVTGERYHSLYRPAPSSEVQERLVFNPRDREAQVRDHLREYWAQMPTLQRFYPDAIHVNADQDPHTVFESIESRLVGRLPKTLMDVPAVKST